jgi:hypothetical protein
MNDVKEIKAKIFDVMVEMERLQNVKLQLIQQLQQVEEESVKKQDATD